MKKKLQLLDLFYAKSHKKQKITFCMPVSEFPKISTLNLCNGLAFSKVAASNFATNRLSQLLFSQSFQQTNNWAEPPVF